MMYDFIVIGAGMVGASIAYELASTARVCVSRARTGLDSTPLHAPPRYSRPPTVAARSGRSPGRAALSSTILLRDSPSMRCCEIEAVCTSPERTNSSTWTTWSRASVIRAGRSSCSTSKPPRNESPSCVKVISPPRRSILMQRISKSMRYIRVSCGAGELPVPC